MNGPYVTPLDRQQVFSKNLALLLEEETSLVQEKQLLLRDYFESHISPRISFSAAAARLLEAYWDKRKSEGQRNRKNITREKLLLATLLAEHYSPDDFSNTEEEFKPLPKEARIAYWGANRHSAVALERFSQLFEKTNPTLAQSFSDVCEMVGDMESDFGVVPIENSFDGRLGSFYRMLDKNELKIIAVCNIEDDAGESSTRFALVSSSVCQWENDYTQWIELSASSFESSRILELISVAEILKMPVKRLSSVPLYYRGNVCVDTITLAIPKDAKLIFFIYLYLFGKDINLLGLFIQI